MLRHSLLLCLCLAAAAPGWGLSAAAGKIDITPDPGRAVFMAGFGARGRRSQGVHDPLYARLLVLREGRRTVALAAFDLLGLYREDVEDIRRRAGFTGPDRYLFVTATHVHSGPDTLGMWGPLPGLSGRDPEYMRGVKQRTADALRGLVAELREAELSAWRGRLDPRGLCRDLRDPAVIDPYLSALRLRDRAGRDVATLVDWSCHPEALGPDNRLITADYPGRLCARIESRTRGACIFINGAIGGLLAPDLRPGQDPWSESERIGAAVADAALRGLARSGPAGGGLDFKTRTALVPVENSRYLLFLPTLSAGHSLRDRSGAPLPPGASRLLSLRHALRGLRPQELPWVETEVARLDIGPARILGLPVEVFPELWIGGYDGRFRGGQPRLKPGNPDPPDLSRAPAGPYLEDLLGGRFPMLAGMANDALGYMVPAYDFKANPALLMLPRPPGDHHEETNSLGPSSGVLILDAARSLLR